MRALVISEIERNEETMRGTLSLPVADASLVYLVAQRNAFERVLELIAGLRRSEATGQ